MPEAIPIVLWSWVPVSILLFWKLPPARAAVASLVGGWLFLPTAWFDAGAAVDFPYWIMPSCLPSDYWTTKARVIGVALLLGVMAFDPGAWRRFRPSAFDLPMLGWCLCPLASGLANGLGPVEAMADSAYLSLAWGVPYLVGRLYFADPIGLELLARGLVVGGLIYAPLCLVEFAAGPIFYPALYGFHPYQHDGVSRYFGHRPIVFLEHGNQLGIWMASSALTATWLRWAGRMRHLLGMPGSLVAGVLVGLSLLFQSVGANILMFAVLGTFAAIRLSERAWPIVVFAVLILGFLVFRAANLVDTKAVAQRSAMGRAAIDFLRRTDRASLGWRLRVEERQGRIALQRPWLGWGRWDWWRVGPERPWGLFSLTFGSFGLTGLALLNAVFWIPILAFLNLGPPRFWANPSRVAAAALVASLVLNELDAVFNSNLMLHLTAVAGGLVGLRDHAAAASAWIRRAQAA
jgi:hypothetical protein